LSYELKGLLHDEKTQSTTVRRKFPEFLHKGLSVNSFKKLIRNIGNAGSLIASIAGERDLGQDFINSTVLNCGIKD